MTVGLHFMLVENPIRSPLSGHTQSDSGNLFYCFSSYLNSTNLCLLACMLLCIIVAFSYRLSSGLVYVWTLDLWLWTLGLVLVLIWLILSNPLISQFGWFRKMFGAFRIVIKLCIALNLSTVIWPQTIMSCLPFLSWFTMYSIL